MDMSNSHGFKQEREWEKSYSVNNKEAEDIIPVLV